jgi:hypothetical protein
LTSSILLTAGQLLQFLRKLLQCLSKLLVKTLWTTLTLRTACTARLVLALSSARQAGNCLLDTTSGLLDTTSDLFQSSCGLLQAAGSLFQSTQISHHAHCT